MELKIHKNKFGKMTISKVFFFILVILSLGDVSAADYTVSGDSFVDVQDTVDSVNYGDTIILGNKTYTSDSSKNIIITTDNVIIKGQSAYSKARLNGQGSNSTIMLIKASNILLENIIFENVDTNVFGGAISSSRPNLTIVNCEFINNKAMVGGIHLNDDSTNVLIRNCVFINNVAAYSNSYGGGKGGAIGSRSSHTQIINCRFTNNSAIGSGGAIMFMFGTDNTVSGCTFTDNNALDGGAIMAVTPRTTLKIINTNFNNNKAKNNGGALYSVNSLTVSNSNFINNIAINGGGLYAIGTISINRNSKFTSNSAYKGAAIFSKRNKMTIGKTKFNINKASISLSVSLNDKVVKYGKTKVNVKVGGYNNNIRVGNEVPIWSDNYKNVKINGKTPHRYTLKLGTKLIIKVNDKFVKVKSKSKAGSSVKIATNNINYNWKNFSFKATYKGNKIIKKSTATLKVSAKIANTDVYNRDKNKKSNRYYPYRKDKLQTKYPNGKVNTKIIGQYALDSVYLLGGEKVPADLRKFLAKWNGVVDVNEKSIKNRVIFTLKSKEYSNKGKLTPLNKAKFLQKWVSNNLKYIRSADLGGSKALKNRRGNCAGYSNLYVSLARTAGIPTSYLYMNDKLQGYHVFTLVYIKNRGSWKVYKVEPQTKGFNKDSLHPTKINWTTSVNYDVYGHELVFPHWYSGKKPAFNFIRYLSSHDYWHLNYNKNAYLIHPEKRNV